MGDILLLSSCFSCSYTLTDLTLIKTVKVIQTRGVAALLPFILIYQTSRKEVTIMAECDGDAPNTEVTLKD